MKIQKIFDTIIIGAGAAGLGCAHQLLKHKKDFLILTEDIGGRIATSANGQINYGAYFVLKNYRHILPYVKKGEKLHPFEVEFHEGKKRHYHLVRMARHPIQALRLLRLLFQFKPLYETFKKECERQSQKQVIEGSSILKKLYGQTAQSFVNEKKIATIANEFLSEGVYMCSFLPLLKVSAFDFLRLCLGLILPAYEFTFLKKKAIKGLEKKIVNTTVKKIKKGETYQVYTSKGKRYNARHLVVATPPPVSKKLLGIRSLKKGANACVLHVAGTLKKEWREGQFELFNSDSPVIFIREQKDGTHIFYSKTLNPNLKEYFVRPQVLFKKEWKPAFNLTGNSLLENEQAKNLFIVGDYNLIGLEDSYITGLYAANRILGKAQGSY